MMEKLRKIFMAQIEAGLGKRGLAKHVAKKMWNIESKPIAWDDDSDYNRDYSSSSLTDSDFRSPDHVSGA